jgi:hypothetical protein
MRSAQQRDTARAQAALHHACAKTALAAMRFQRVDASDLDRSVQPAWTESGMQAQRGSL